MDLSTTFETFGQEDQSWLGSEHGTSSCPTVTLDMSLFASADYVGGILPSGFAIAKHTSGKYGPYTPGGANGLQTAKGILFTSQRVKSSTSLVAAPIYKHGRVVLSKLPVQVTGQGFVDATAIAALPMIDFV
jgi:hypothetical protein